MSQLALYYVISCMSSEIYILGENIIQRRIMIDLLNRNPSFVPTHILISFFNISFRRGSSCLTAISKYCKYCIFLLSFQDWLSMIWGWLYLNTKVEFHVWKSETSDLNIYFQEQCWYWYFDKGYVQMVLPGILKRIKNNEIKDIIGINIVNAVLCHSISLCLLGLLFSTVINVMIFKSVYWS